MEEALVDRQQFSGIRPWAASAALGRSMERRDNVEEMTRKILDSGVVRKLEVPDPHLYFQAPGGQCLRLVGIDEDLSFYEGAGDGPNVAKVREVVNKC